MKFNKFLTLIGLLLLESCLTTDATNSTSTSTNYNSCGSPLLGSNQPSGYNDCVLDKTGPSSYCCYAEGHDVNGTPMSLCIRESTHRLADIISVYPPMMLYSLGIFDKYICEAPRFNSAPDQVERNTCGVPSLGGSIPTAPSNCTLDTSIGSNSCIYISLQIYGVDLPIDACMKYSTATIPSLMRQYNYTDLASAMNYILYDYGISGYTFLKVDCGSHFVSLYFLMVGFLLLLF